ncbi:MAG: superoxide dismutase family protein [Candidatus Eiseniibacteriota bacterium]|jgi:Cu-Zn family superoxide dismutase
MIRIPVAGRMSIITFAVASVAWLGGCQSMEQQGDDARAAGGSDADTQSSAAGALAAVSSAVCVIHPVADSGVKGEVHFEQDGDQVRIVADLDGLEPGQKHGIHIHEYGDCSAADGTSAGGHYNPEGYPHALPPTARRHAGDLGNIEADASGHGHLEITVSNVTIAGPKHPILGRAIIVHARPDDGGQPTGNAGARIGCGSIGIDSGGSRS